MSLLPVEIRHGSGQVPAGFQHDSGSDLNSLRLLAIALLTDCLIACKIDYRQSERRLKWIIN